MAGDRPMVIPVDADCRDRLAVLAQLRGRGATPAEIAVEAIRSWLAGPGQRELAEAADRLAGPRLPGG